MPAQKNIYWFSEIDKGDIDVVGGKGANLGEMTKAKFPVPNGFVVSSQAYFAFVEANNLETPIKKILLSVDPDDPYSYTQVSVKIKKLIIQSPMPKDIAVDIAKSYFKLSGMKNIQVAVRSSATAEDLPGASFAGQQATFLNISGEANVIKMVKEAWASLFEPRAIFYREEKKFDHFKVGIAVPVQKMIQSEISGVMFTIDPVTGIKDHLVVEAVYGLGELIVQGTVTPDHFLVNKESMEIINQVVSKQEIELTKINGVTKQRKIMTSKQELQKISNKNVLELAEIGKRLQDHYFFPQDVEWAIDKGKIYIVQTRPITTLTDEKEPKKDKKDEVTAEQKSNIILRGAPASPGIATGPVRIVKNLKEIGKVKKDEVLVTIMTTPDFVPVMKKAIALITDRGGQTSHAAIVSRELGLPCVVGTENATSVLKDGQYVTVNGKTGEVYKATIKTMAKEQANQGQQKVYITSEATDTATNLYVNLAEPDIAGSIARMNVDGVGLLRAEFMIAQIGIHPKKLIADRKQNVFIDKLAAGLETFCSQFNPRPVIYRATDFKTNEYRNLIGGKEYEPEESNPMLGFRGAYRYIADERTFELELEAIKKVREKYKNLQLMIPFVHTPWELREVKKIITSAGLSRSSTFKLYMMVEIPSNIILLPKFIEVGIDGISIGSNDLTMLILGVDRDNSDVAQVYNERDEAVLWALENAIKTCHKYKITSSICGQAPSEYPDLVEKLVEWGITSISVSPDTIVRTREIIYDAEKKLLKNK